MIRFFLVLAWACSAGLLGSCATAPDSGPLPVRDGEIFVVAANPLAVEAGLGVLRRGGSAVDAAIAIEATLSLVEPQSSGIGGGAFLTYYDAGTKRIEVYDGRETAPAGATPDMFLDDGGKPLTFDVAVLSGRATGVPGLLRMLELAHGEHGRLAWSSLFGEPQHLAREGFLVTPRLARFINGSAPEASAPDVRAYFARPGGGLLQAGDRLRN
ncbi:MAG TPA: gamma-glutamyltransferase, partial [Allosphingosinicella sp.]|nr:gamma-glutamyltransferase [Allosphingosinicella sp.]